MIRLNVWGTSGIAVLTSVLLFSQMGCSDDKKGSGKLNVNKLVSELDEGEVKALCESLAERFNKVSDADMTKIACTYLGVSLGESLSESCDAYTQSCIDDSPEEPEQKINCDSAEFETEFKEFASQCHVTVGKLQTCFTEMGDNLVSLKDTISCEDTFEELAPKISPESCTSIDDQCPVIGGNPSNDAGFDDAN